jgi:hypothetical protein
MEPYKITKEDKNLIEDFIERSANSHIKYTRSTEQVKADIKVGKLGEIAYKNHYKDSINGVDWKGLVQMDGIDFTHIDGRGIQVKTLNRDTQWCTFYDWKWDVIAVMRIIGSEIHLIGEYNKEQIKKIARESNWKGWYFDPKNC